MGSTARIGKWDNVKGALIVLVVLGHVIDLYTQSSINARRIFVFIYTFHMPLFIFISGMFSKRCVREKDYKKAVPFLVLYFFIIIIRCLTMMITQHRFTESFFNEDGAQWYCLAIFFFYLITIALRNANKKYVMICSVVLACFIGYDPSIGDYLTFSRIIVFYPLFYFGYCLERESLEKIFSNKLVWIIAAAVLIIYAAIVYTRINDIYKFRPLLTGRNPFNKLKDWRSDYGALLRLCYYAVSLIISACFLAIIPNRSKLLSMLGNRSLQIYALHFIPLQLLVHKAGMLDLFKKIWPAHHMWLSIPVSVAIALFCSIKIFGVPFEYIRRNGEPKPKNEV